MKNVSFTASIDLCDTVHKNDLTNDFEDIPRNLYGSYKVVDCNFRNIFDRNKMIHSIPYPWDIFHHLLQFHILGATR